MMTSFLGHLQYKMSVQFKSTCKWMHNRHMWMGQKSGIRNASRNCKIIRCWCCSLFRNHVQNLSTDQAVRDSLVLGWLYDRDFEHFESTEKLYHDLNRDLPNFVNIMQLPKSPGVQPIGTVREDTRTQLVKLSVSSRLQVWVILMSHF